MADANIQTVSMPTSNTIIKFNPSKTFQKTPKKFIHKDFTTKREDYKNPLFSDSRKKGYNRYNLNFNNKIGIDREDEMFKKKLYHNQENDKKHFLILANALINSK